MKLSFSVLVASMLMQYSTFSMAAAGAETGVAASSRVEACAAAKNNAARVAELKRSKKEDSIKLGSCECEYRAPHHICVVSFETKKESE